MYSTAIQIRQQHVKLKSDVIGDDIIEDRISMGDQKIRVDLSSVVNFDAVPSIGEGTQEVINFLSVWQATELTLIYLYGDQRKEGTDVSYYQELYNNAVANILAGITVVPGAGVSTGTFTNSSKTNVEPTLGEGVWGDFVNKETLAEVRPT